MINLERQIQKVRSGKWAELEELGFPAKRRCRSLAGGFITDMLIIERQSDGFAALESVYEKAVANPEHRALSEDAERILESQQIEFYLPLA